MTALELQTATANPLSDDDVVRRVIAGETELFEILMRRYNQRVYRVVRGILRNDDDAEDVMQQAYVNAYEHLRQFAGDAKFSTWLTRIAINEALARVRKRGLRVVDDESEIMEIESSDPDPEQLAAASELRAAVESEIASLPDSYRTVLMLREIEGLSTAETAQCLDVNEDVVKTRLHRARTILRDNLYRRAGLTFDGLFPFGNARCDRVVAAVFSRIAALPRGPAA
ncbi:MAG TPA: RNA polymerase sigma factor [Thermoanaerobaculia bacterium]|nr:RNA polymerase sigma factor [Thermoanaerobaculia bacterium]